MCCMKLCGILPELPFQRSSVSEIFDHLHQTNIERFGAYSPVATKRKLSGAYWIDAIFNHFLFLIITGNCIVFIFDYEKPIYPLLVSMLPASCLIFIILFLTAYWPLYQLEFLPKLDNCMENYANKKLDGIQQCKKEQYSVMTLMLIQFAYCQLMGINQPELCKENYLLLSRQYGVSVKSIDNVLQLIVLGKWDRKSIRKRTEILNGFEDAINYFNKVSCNKAIPILNLLQQKLLHEK